MDLLPFLLLQNDGRYFCGSLGSGRQSKSWKMLVSAPSSLGSRLSACSSLQAFFLARQHGRPFIYGLRPCLAATVGWLTLPPTHTSRLEPFLARSCQRLVFEFHFAFGIFFYVFGPNARHLRGTHHSAVQWIAQPSAQ